MRSRVSQSELEVKGKGVSVGVAQQIFPVLTCDPFLGIGCKGPWVIMCKPPISITSDYRIYEGRELKYEKSSSLQGTIAHTVRWALSS